MKKMKLRVDALSVESFATGQDADARGTVRGRDGCTYVDTCLCPTAYYHCGTGPATIHSCDFTEICATELCETEGCASGDWRCEKTVRCPTPPITPGC
jgi:hypothetical protein